MDIEEFYERGLRLHPRIVKKVLDESGNEYRNEKGIAEYLEATGEEIEEIHLTQAGLKPTPIPVKNRIIELLCEQEEVKATEVITGESYHFVIFRYPDAEENEIYIMSQYFNDYESSRDFYVYNTKKDELIFLDDDEEVREYDNDEVILEQGTTEFLMMKEEDTNKIIIYDEAER